MRQGLGKLAESRGTAESVHFEVALFAYMALVATVPLLPRSCQSQITFPSTVSQLPMACRSQR